jgi:hypothetical protein
VSRSENFLDGAESVAFDSLNDRYLVSSAVNGIVVEIDSLGNQSIFKMGLGQAMGNCLVGNTLYVSIGTSVVGIDLSTKQFVMEAFGGLGVDLDGLTADTSGNLYAVDRRNLRLYRIPISDPEILPFLDSGLPAVAQDIVFDIHHNRILMCGYGLNAPIKAVNLSDTTVETVAQFIGRSDGITVDHRGFVYATSHATGCIYMWDSSLANPPITLTCGHDDPAGIDYNWRDDILAIPSFVGDRVDFVQCQVPRLETAGSVVEEVAGDGDGHADPGETLELTPVLRNDLWESHNAELTLASDDPHVTITNAMTTFEECPGLGTATTAPTPFSLTISSACPDPHLVPFSVTITTEQESVSVDTLYLFVGDTPGFSDSLESDAPGWLHSSPTPNYTDQWHLSNTRSFSGDFSWKAGDTGSGSYANLHDGALLTPPFLLPERPELTLMHRIDAEGATSAGVAYDAAIVAISSGDGQWTLLNPDSGYTHTTVSDITNPLGPDMPCFSGSADWTGLSFDLSEYSGVVQLMFRFVSDAAVGAEGWYLDDIVVDQAGCCRDIAGNVDGDAEELIDIGDLTRLIDYLYISNIEPECLSEANVDGDTDGLVDIGDLTALIDYLYISTAPPAACL